MKFNEKLIKLRKSKGMSQEELGEKLNVTRQTVSKWELGITTPEMDKLIEMSKIFNITVDELIKEENIEANKEEKESKSNNIADKTKEKSIKKWIIIIAVIFLAVLIIYVLSIISARYLFNEGKKAVDEASSQGIQTVSNFLETGGNKIVDFIDSQKDKSEEEYKKSLEEQNAQKEQAQKDGQKFVEEGLKNSQELIKKYTK